MLLENLSIHLTLGAPKMLEVDFLIEVARPTGCGLFLDTNNLFISVTNLGFARRSYLEGFPLLLVGEIHLRGHVADQDKAGTLRLIDSHRHPVADPVWEMYAEFIAQVGPKQTLIEWRNDTSDWAVLQAEAALAAAVPVVAS